MKQQRKEFIKQAHSAACSEWKEKIETEFPKLFKKDELIVGKWYKHDEKAFNALMVWGDSEYTYGFWNGEYKDNLCFRDAFNKVPATDKEVSEALIAEASKRGYKKGVKFKLIEGVVGKLNESIITSAYEILYQASLNRLVLKSYNDLYTIFRDGVWAEIIEEPVNVLKSDLELAALALKEMSNAFSEWKEEPVYEWQYVYLKYGFPYEDIKSSGYYTSKKDFIKRQGHLTPIKKVKESKRIRK